MDRYLVTIRKTVNTVTGNTCYYKLICGVMTRISKAEYLEHCKGCNGVADIFAVKTRVYRKIEKVLSFYL